MGYQFSPLHTGHITPLTYPLRSVRVLACLRKKLLGLLGRLSSGDISTPPRTMGTAARGAHGPTQSLLKEAVAHLMEFTVCNIRLPSWFVAVSLDFGFQETPWNCLLPSVSFQRLSPLLPIYSLSGMIGTSLVSTCL